MKFIYLVKESLLSFLNQLGNEIIKCLCSLGNCVRFFTKITFAIFTPPWYPKEFVIQLFKIHFESISVVCLTAFCSGAVIMLQTFLGIQQPNLKGPIIGVVTISFCRELAATMTGLMMAGNIGSLIATELGSMKITSQIIAMKNLSVDPIRYLVVPRVLATCLTTMALVFLSTVSGIFGACVISVSKLNFDSLFFINAMLEYLHAYDIFVSIMKGLFFGVIISYVASYQGFNTRDSAQGVGASTTRTVVLTFILIFVANYVMSEIMFNT